jgi:hypothetical protein
MHVFGQQTLPEFSVVTFGNNKNIISWLNPYPNVTQINIQRSRDSLKSFTSILAIPDPSNQQNGFVDAKAPTPFVFYRLFVVFDNGTYIFTSSKRAFWDTVRQIPIKPKNPLPPLEQPDKKEGEVKSNPIPANLPPVIPPAKNIEKIEENNPPLVLIKTQQLELEDKTKKSPKESPLKNDSKKVAEKDSVMVIPEPPAVERIFVIRKKDSFYLLEQKNFKRFIDSLSLKTKDSVVFRSIDTIEIKPLIVKEVYKASRFVLVDKNGNLQLNLPEAGPRLYSLKFYDDKKMLLFELKKIKDDGLLLDKANFMESGWYDFELFEDGKLKEKNKVFIPKESANPPQKLP